MSSLNRATLIGNLGRDPEVRYAQSGDRVATLAVATSQRWRDKHSGEQREKTEWHRVVIFDQKLAEVAEKYLRKGSKVFLEGELRTRKWTDNSGQDRYTTEIVMQGWGSRLLLMGERGGGGQEGSAPATATGGDAGRSGDPLDLDDDIPF